jgi:NAD-dependent dihydropyrimidine dehydrogenase PreA subunit/nitroreductase
MAVVHSQYREAGTVTIDESTCGQCGLCAQVCPTEVLRFADERVSVHPDSTFGCIACGQCMMVCPDGSVTVRGRGVSPDDLVDLPPREQRATAEGLAALMTARRSVRRFSSRDVERELLQQVLAMASSAPMGIPPWDVGCVVINGRERVREVAFDVARGYERLLKVLSPTALKLVRPFMRPRTHAQLRTFILPLAQTYVERYRRGEDVIFYGAPAVLVFHHSPYADLADASIACTYAMLAAESLGLGTTMIGGAPPLIQRDKGLCRRLGIPDGNKPTIALILGYPAVTYRRAIRRPFVSVTQR